MSPKTLLVIAIVVTSAAIAIWFILAGWLVFQVRPTTISDLTSVGIAIGALSPLFSALALGGIVFAAYTIVQQATLGRQSRELSLLFALTERYNSKDFVRIRDQAWLLWEDIEKSMKGDSGLLRGTCTYFFPEFSQFGNGVPAASADAATGLTSLQALSVVLSFWSHFVVLEQHGISDRIIRDYFRRDFLYWRVVFEALNKEILSQARARTSAGHAPIDLPLDLPALEQLLGTRA